MLWGKRAMPTQGRGLGFIIWSIGCCSSCRFGPLDNGLRDEPRGVIEAFQKRDKLAQRNSTVETMFKFRQNIVKLWLLTEDLPTLNKHFAYRGGQIHECAREFPQNFCRSNKAS